MNNTSITLCCSLQNNLVFSAFGSIAGVIRIEALSMKTLAYIPVLYTLLQTIYLNRMNIFFRFCMSGVIWIMPRIRSAQVFTLEQILSSLKVHFPALARANVRQAPIQTVLQTGFHPCFEEEIDGSSLAGINSSALNGGKQLQILLRHWALPFLLLQHPPIQNLGQQVRYTPPAMKNDVEKESALLQWQTCKSPALPLWSQRQCAIANVRYGLRQSGVVACQLELLLVREFINAYDSYLISKRLNALINLERLIADDLKG